MKHIRSLSLLLLSLLCLQTAYSQPTWVSLGRGDGTTPRIVLDHNTTDSVVFTVAITGFYKEDLDHNGTTYQKIWIPDESSLTDSGFPELPVISKLIAIPACDSAVVNVTSFSNILLSGYLIYPAPKEPPGMEEPIFCKNDSLYDTSDYYPGQLKDCSSIDAFRDQWLVELRLKPIWFSPDSGKLRVCDSLRVRLTFMGATGSINEDVGIFNAAAQTMFLNYDRQQTDVPPAQQAWHWCTPANIASYDCDYLIITAGFIYGNPSCQNKIQELAAHRAAYNGFHVCLVNVEDITGWQTWTSVKNFIAYVYNLQSSPISSDGHLPFVLLVGDAWDDDGYGGGGASDPLIPRTQAVPSNYLDYASDHYYADIVGSGSLAVEDLAIGRLPVGNNSVLKPELDTIINKIIQYETSSAPAGHDAWKRYATIQGGYVPPSDLSWLRPHNPILGYIHCQFDQSI